MRKNHRGTNVGEKNSHASCDNEHAGEKVASTSVVDISFETVTLLSSVAVRVYM